MTALCVSSLCTEVFAHLITQCERQRPSFGSVTSLNSTPQPESYRACACLLVPHWQEIISVILRPAHCSKEIEIFKINFVSAFFQRPSVLRGTKIKWNGQTKRSGPFLGEQILTKSALLGSSVGQSKKISVRSQFLSTCYVQKWSFFIHERIIVLFCHCNCVLSGSNNREGSEEWPIISFPFVGEGTRRRTNWNWWVTRPQFMVCLPFFPKNHSSHRLPSKPRRSNRRSRVLFSWNKSWPFLALCSTFIFHVW